MKSYNWITLLLLISLYVGLIEAQNQFLTIVPPPSDSSSIQLMNMNPFEEKCSGWNTEMSICINPANEKNMLIGCNNSHFGVTYHYSNDAGKSWSCGGQLPDVNWGSDPVVAFGSNGTAYYNYLQYYDAIIPYWKVRLTKSTDGGINWNPPLDITDYGLADKNHMAVDGNNVYIAWTDFTSGYGPYPIKLSYSNDSGNSFSNYVQISYPTIPNNDSAAGQGVNLAVGPEGNVYAVWAIYNKLDSIGCENALGFNVSTDHGVSWLQTAKTIFNIYGIRNGIYGWDDKNPYGEKIRINSFPSMAVDRSNGLYNGNIYIVWADRRNDRSDILLAKSTDFGSTWVGENNIRMDQGGIPVRVNQDTQDLWNFDQWFPTITVNPDGVINIVFYDSRNDPYNKLTEVWVAQSIDGGLSFKDFKVSESSFYPFPIYTSGYMGDYIGIASTKDYSYPCWMAPADTLVDYNYRVVPFGSLKKIGQLSNDWNMVSLPVAVHDSSAFSLYPEKINDVFGFNGSVYDSRDPLETKSGYWVQIGEEPSEITYVGAPLDSIRIHVSQGWNMIGSISTSLLTNKIYSIPSGIVSKGYFTWTGESPYVASTIIEPGKTYWVYASQAGDLVMDINAPTQSYFPSTNGAPPSPPSPPSPPTLYGTTILQGGTKYPKLRWTRSATATSYKLYTYLCEGTLDCLGEGQISVVYEGTDTTCIDYSVTVGNKYSPNRERYYVTASNYFGQSNISNKVIYSTDLDFQWKAHDNENDENVVAIPTVTELKGNYPNPFNPQTTIYYAIAEDNRVILTMTNILGQEIKLLVDEYQNAGYKSFIFDAGDLPSGIFFYRLQAGKFNSVKKMILAR
jgi:hypothetical protein